jgi:hypothetical protein
MKAIAQRITRVYGRLLPAVVMGFLGLALSANVASAQPGNRLLKKTFTFKEGTHAMKRFWHVYKVHGRVSHFQVHVQYQTGHSVGYWQKGRDFVSVTGMTGGKEKKGLFGTGGRLRGDYFGWVTVYYYPYRKPIITPGSDWIRIPRR